MNTKDVIEILNQQVGKYIVVSAMYNDFSGKLSNLVQQEDTFIVLDMGKKNKQYIKISEIYGINIEIKMKGGKK